MIFSGDRSRPMWDWINRRDGLLWSILYSVGCRLQEIEAWVCRRGRRRIKLEGREHD